MTEDGLSTKGMNWNIAWDTGSQLITLRFACRVGGIMSEVGPSLLMSSHLLEAEVRELERTGVLGHRAHHLI